MAGPADQFGVRNSELNEKCSGHAVGAPSASLRPCGRPRGTVLVCRVLWRMRGERIFFLFACPKRKNQRETTLGRGRLRFLPLPRPTLMETPKRGAPLLDLPRADRIRQGLLRLPGSPRRAWTSPAPTWGPEGAARREPLPSLRDTSPGGGGEMGEGRLYRSPAMAKTGAARIHAPPRSCLNNKN